MATKTFEELKQLAIQIRDEKTNKQNTGTRVGTAMLEHINKLEQDYYDKTKTDEELKERDDKLTELSDNVGLYNVDKNVPLGSGFYISTTARNAVPSSVRKLGLIITYKTDETTSVTEQFIGSAVSGWATDTNWKNVGSEYGNKILAWNTDIANTRKQVPSKERKSLLKISYRNADGDIINEQYIGTTFTDAEWIKDENWNPSVNQVQVEELKEYNFNESSGNSIKTIILKNFENYVSGLFLPFDFDGIISVEDKYIKYDSSLQNLSLVSANGYKLFIRRTFEGEELDFNIYIRDISVVTAIVYCTDNDITTAIAQYNTYNSDKRIVGKFTTPHNANYVFFCFDKNRDKGISYIQYSIDTQWILDSNKFNKRIAEKSTYKDITYDIDFKSGYLNYEDKIISSNISYSVSDYIELTNVNGFLVRFTFENNVSPIAFYNNDKQVILMLKGNTVDKIYETYIDRSQFPKNAKYVRFCNQYPWVAADKNNKLVPGGFKLFVGLLVNDRFNDELNGYCANYWKKGDKCADLVKDAVDVDTEDGYPLSIGTHNINRNFFGFSRFIEKFTFAFDDLNSKVKIEFGTISGITSVTIDFITRKMMVGKNTKDIPSKFGVSECSLVVHSENDRSYVELINGVCEKILFENVPIYNTNTQTVLTGYESNTKILNYSCNIPKVDVLFGGDSITFGIGVTSRENLCWALFAKDNPHISVGTYALGGQKIEWFWLQRYYISHYIKPKYIVFNFGANGGNSIELFNRIQEYFKFYGIGVIINYISNTTLEERKQQTDDNNLVIKEWLSDHAIIKHSAKYDLCTSIDGIYENGADSSTLNDGLHPNNLGNQRMYERIKSDLPELYSL